MKTPLESYRQGDILLVKVDRVPEGETKTVRDYVIAYGEASGHSHTLKGDSEVTKTEEGKVYLSISKPGIVTHQTHGDHELSAGHWEARRQREETPEEPRTVAD